MTRIRDPEKQKEYARKHYEKNKPAMVARAKEFTDTVTRPRIRRVILDYLREHTCLDCSETDPIVLEFDHRAGEEKLFEIGIAVRKSIGLDRLRAEIAKCDVRCANCHRRKTYLERGYKHRNT